MVGMYELGKTSSQIGKKLDIAHQTIFDVLKRSKLRRTIVSLKPPGRPPNMVDKMDCPGQNYIQILDTRTSGRPDTTDER